MEESSTNAVRGRLDTYFAEGLDAVKGWFDTDSAEVISVLLGHQLDTDVRGDVAEIGVHHGKSFLLLANGVRDDERGVALDVFEDQDLNVDNSGQGDRAAFERNIAAWAPDRDIEIVQASSTDVAVADAAATFGRVRLFSVDGGHTSEITLHDLRLAEAVLVDDGVVVLDDVLNPHWLGVLTGLAYYLTGEHRLVPFAYSSNKLYLATPAAASGYAKVLREALPDLLGKSDVELLGSQIDIYGQGSPRVKKRYAEDIAERNSRRSAVAAAEASVSAAQGRIEEIREAREVDKRRYKDLELVLQKEKATRVAAEKRNAALTGSTSWRLTAPVRALAGRRKTRRQS